MLAKVASGSHVGKAGEKRCAFRGQLPEPILFGKKATPLQFWERQEMSIQPHQLCREADPHLSPLPAFVSSVLVIGSIFCSLNTLLALCNSSIDPSIPDPISKPTIVHVYM